MCVLIVTALLSVDRIGTVVKHRVVITLAADGLISTPNAGRPAARNVRMSPSPRCPALPVTRIVMAGKSSIEGGWILSPRRGGGERPCYSLTAVNE